MVRIAGLLACGNADRKPDKSHFPGGQEAASTARTTAPRINKAPDEGAVLMVRVPASRCSVFPKRCPDPDRAIPY